LVIRPTITEGRVALAKQKLEKFGILFEHVNDDVNILQKPNDLPDGDAYPLVREALSDRYEGPWTFTVEVNP
jgi:hypothetical protein